MTKHEIVIIIFFDWEKCPKEAVSSFFLAIIVFGRYQTTKIYITNIQKLSSLYHWLTLMMKIPKNTEKIISVQIVHLFRISQHPISRGLFTFSIVLILILISLSFILFVQRLACFNFSSKFHCKNTPHPPLQKKQRV